MYEVVAYSRDHYERREFRQRFRTLEDATQEAIELMLYEKRTVAIWAVEERRWRGTRRRKVFTWRSLKEVVPRTAKQKRIVANAAR